MANSTQMQPVGVALKPQTSSIQSGQAASLRRQSSTPAKSRPKSSPLLRGRPIHLTATAVITPTAAGSPNNQALHSPVAQPIEIYEFKFAFNIPLPGTANPLSMDGGNILVQLSLNGDMLTNGYVPLWSFDESTNIVNEVLAGETNTTPTPQITTAYGEFKWRLAKPLYLRPSDQITVSFQNLGQQAISVNCRVSLSGCVLENTSDPKTRAIPYVCAYISTLFSTVAAQTDQSSETQLQNATDSLVYMHMLTGRVDNYPTSQLPGVAFHYDNPPNGYADLGVITTIQAYSGNGTQLIPYSVNFRDLFGPVRAVPLTGVLVPGDYVIVALSKAVNPASAVIYGQLSVGLVGWREVPIR